MREIVVPALLAFVLRLLLLSVFLWLFQKFTGHSTEVFRLLPVLKPSVGDDGESDPYFCSYFLSAAVNDRVINAWQVYQDCWHGYYVNRVCG